MKIFEIISTKQDVVDTGDEFDFDRVSATFGQDILRKNSGVYSVGEPTDDPHTFKKKNYYPSNLENDSYYIYINSIKDLSDKNPYFPRVYRITLKRDSRGLVVPEYDIETLKTAEEFSFESLMAVGERLYKDFRQRYLVKGKEEDPDLVFDEIVNYLSFYVANNMLSYILDPQLRKAIEHISRIKHQNPIFSWDLHAGNIMIRGTPNGPQLVITDPLKEKDFSSQIKKAP